MPLVIKNNAVGLLQLGIGAGAVSTTLQAGHTMPALGAGDYCFATLVSTSNTVEVVKVTAIVGDVITHAATSNAFAAGSRFELRPCKEAIDALMQEATVKASVTLAGTDTYTGTASPVPTSYVGIAWLLKFTNANTIAAPTVNLNSLGAKTIKNRDGSALVAGDIKAGSVHVGFYDGTNMVLTTLETSVPAVKAISLIDNGALAVTVAANAITIALKTAAGADPTPADPVRFGFRKTGATTAGFEIRSVTGALSMTVSAGSALGFAASETNNIHVGVLDNAGTVELCVAKDGAMFQEDRTQSTTAEGGAGAADSGSTLYSTTARAGVAVRLLAVVDVTTSATPGNWSAVNRVTPVAFNPLAPFKNAVKAWLNYNGSSGAVRDSFGVSSVTKNSTGDYTVSFTKAFRDANYLALPVGNGDRAVLSTFTQAVGSLRTALIRTNDSAAQDAAQMMYSFAGDQ